MVEQGDHVLLRIFDPAMGEVGIDRRDHRIRVDLPGKVDEIGQRDA
jgi:hypothetical protein